MLSVDMQAMGRWSFSRNKVSKKNASTNPFDANYKPAAPPKSVKAQQIATRYKSVAPAKNPGSLWSSFVNFFNFKSKNVEKPKILEPLNQPKSRMKSLTDKSSAAWQSVSNSLSSAGAKTKTFVKKSLSPSKKVDQMSLDVQSLDGFLRNVSNRPVVSSMSEGAMGSLSLSSRPFLGKGKFEVRPQDASQAIAARVSMLSKDLLDLSNMKKKLDISLRENQRRSGDKTTVIDKQKYAENNKKAHQVVEASAYVMNELVVLLVKSEKAFGTGSVKMKHVEDNILSHVDPVARKNIVSLVQSKKNQMLDRIRPPLPSSPAPSLPPSVAPPLPSVPAPKSGVQLVRPVKPPKPPRSSKPVIVFK